MRSELAAARERTHPSLKNAPGSSFRTKAARVTPSRSSCAASTLAKGKTSSSRSVA
jgi:hypothetical protein